jgi:hypothetical protein
MTGGAPKAAAVLAHPGVEDYPIFSRCGGRTVEATRVLRGARDVVSPSDDGRRSA